jgi:hypothetical protein
MINYMLTAQRNGKTSRHNFCDETDGDAILYSIFYILKEASKKTIWAQGRIELINVDSNEVIKTMEAK